MHPHSLSIWPGPVPDSQAMIIEYRKIYQEASLFGPQASIKQFRTRLVLTSFAGFPFRVIKSYPLNIIKSIVHLARKLDLTGLNSLNCCRSFFHICAFFLLLYASLFKRPLRSLHWQSSLINTTIPTWFFDARSLSSVQTKHVFL